MVVYPQSELYSIQIIYQKHPIQTIILSVLHKFKTQKRSVSMTIKSNLSDLSNLIYQIYQIKSIKFIKYQIKSIKFFQMLNQIKFIKPNQTSHNIRFIKSYQVKSIRFIKSNLSNLSNHIKSNSSNQIKSVTMTYKINMYRCQVKPKNIMVRDKSTSHSSK